MLSQLSLARGRPPAALGWCLEAEGLQQNEFAIAGSEAEGLYDLHQGVMTQPDMPASVGLPLPKKCKQAATATVSSPTAQESETIVPKPRGSASVQKAPLYPSLNLRRQQYPLEWNLCKLMWAIPSKYIAARSRDVQRDLQPSVLPNVPMFPRPIWAQNYHAHPAPGPF